ncbi:KNTC1 [Mytilus coruscus]|uniref:KNTC1 n=1 Tax=Mytilus coruscus TaxID=42192 RepID=A0A6J8F0M2_MYTCO|nr:KNTC1 [Mytilus coruscus]
MPWDLIATDFGGEETINFGPRQESGIALYQVETLATISSSDKDQLIPCTTVTVLGELACIAVQEHLAMFKDCQQTASIGLDGVIDCIEWSSDGSMLMVGDSTGKLSLLDTDTGDILFSFKVVPEGCSLKTFKRILFSTKSDDTTDLVVLAGNGQMLVLTGITQDLFSADEGKIAASLKEKLIQTRADHFHTEGVSDVVCFDDKIVTLGCGDIAIGVWVIEDGQLVLDDEIPSYVFNGAGVEEGRVSSDGKHLFVLTDNHELLLMNTTTMTALHSWSDIKVDQFQLLETKKIKNQSLQDMKLVLLTVGEGKTTNLMVQSLPSWETIYNLQLHQPSTLASCPTSQETLFLAECSPSEEDKQSYSVRLRCLTETNPETRLYRILHKNRFEEAETFAKLYRLDTELVHKVKALYLLDQLSPWNNNNEEKVQAMSTQFTNCLAYIKDDLHVAEICMRAALSSLKATQKLLDYSKERLLKVSTNKSADPSQKEKQQVLLSKLYEIQHRLVTFKMINGAENYSAERWDIFMKSDLMKVMMSMLQQNQLKKGLIILSRHEYEWEKCVTPTVIKNFLHFIPDHIQTGEIQCILTETIVPTVARILPQILVDVVEWIIQKAKSSELVDKKAWPVNALQFLRSVYGVLVKVVDISYSHSIYTAADITMKTQIERLEVLDLMKTLITNLQHLHDLQTKYNCKLTFGNFLQETTETVTFRMLDKVVAIEMINQTLERQIRPYMREHNLREDIIFSKYIKDLLERSGRMTSYLGEAVWEPKVVAIINCIGSQQYKCDSILEVIKCAPIPWSKEINSLVQQALKLDHDLVNDIKEQVHLMELKNLMHKYNLKKEDIPSDNNWEMLMYYILSQNTTDSIEDAFNVMRGYNVILTHDLYVFRMRHLIKNGMVNECIDLLKSLPGNERLKCGQRIVDYVKVLLNDTVELDIKELHKKKTLFTEAGSYIIKLIVDFEEDYMKSNELRNLLLVLQSLLALQKEYDQYITIDQYCDVNIRTKLLVTYAKQFFMKRESNKKEASKTKVFRLADILQISHVKIQGQLAIEAAKTGGIQTALKYCNMLLESDRTEETAETLYSVALSFLKLQADSENCDLTAGQLRSLPEVTYMLTSEALVVCSGHSDLFMKCLDLNKAASLALSVSQQCEAGEYSICEQEEEMNQEKITPSVEMVSDWMSDSMFKEDALVMNSTVILPFISQYCVCHPTIDGNTEDAECIEKLTTTVKPLLNYLKDNSHIQLAYQALLHMLYTVHQISLVNQMGIQLVNETISEIMTEKKNDLEGIVKTTTPLIKEFTTGVLMKIFSNNFKDHHLALAYVLSGTKRDGQEAVMRIIKTSGHNYRRLRAISYVGIGAGEIYKDPNIINMCQRLEVNAKWGNRLAKIKISFKDAFQMPVSEKAKLLPQVAQSAGADTELIIDFCQAFEVDIDDGLLMYLEHVFTTTEHGTLSGQDVKKIQLKKAKTAIDGIRDEDTLYDKLRKLFYKTDPYDYEKLDFLMEEMRRINDTPESEKHAKVLFYLKQYKRRAPPSEFEINYRHHKDNEEMKILTDSLSPYSSTRIPLHPLLDGANAWKIITPELRKDTISSWLPVSQSLKMSTDQIFIVTIQNMVNSYVSTDKEPATVKSQWNWQKKDANKELLTNVKSLLEKVSNCEMAMACGKWMVTQLPSGAEKVMGLEGCIYLAQKWYQALPESKTTDKEKAKAAVIKFNAMWRRLATEQILFLHGIRTPELHKQADKPKQLIVALYEHPCIVDTTEDADVPDIHAVVEEVANLNDINLQCMMVELLQKWLPSASSKQQDADTTATFNFDNLKLGNETVSTDDDEDDQNLKRVMYLLRRGDREQNLVYLIEFVFTSDQTQERTNMCKLRALHCLLELGEEKLLKDLVARSFDDLRELMKTLTYLVELEKLHILHSVETFQESNKEGLIKGIWRNHYHQKSAALLVAGMCLDFKVHEKQLWNGVLQQILSFELMENLEYILMRLNSVPDVWQIAIYPKAWQTVLVSPLTKVVAPLSSEQLESCVHSFNLLKRCPILHCLDMSVFVQHFLRLEMEVCALSCLLFSGEEESIQSVIARENIRLLDNAEKYLSYSMDSFSAQQVKDYVYDYIINNEEFSMIVETKFLPELTIHAVKQKNIAGLIKFAVEKDRKRDADKVLQLFISENTDYLNRLLKITSGDEGSEFSLLKAYMELEGMGELVYLL